MERFRTQKSRVHLKFRFRRNLRVRKEFRLIRNSRVLQKFRGRVWLRISSTVLRPHFFFCFKILLVKTHLWEKIKVQFRSKQKRSKYRNGRTNAYPSRYNLNQKTPKELAPSKICPIFTHKSLHQKFWFKMGRYFGLKPVFLNLQNVYLDYIIIYICFYSAL